LLCSGWLIIASLHLGDAKHSQSHNAQAYYSMQHKMHINIVVFVINNICMYALYV
jgi:hypothetical protein